MASFLNDTERANLRALHRSEKDRRKSDRMKAVLWADDSRSFKEIASLLFVDEDTARRYVKEYQETKKLHNNGGGYGGKLDKQQTQELINHLEDHTYLKVEDICAYVKQAYQVDYTIQGMNSWLHTHKFSYKRPKGTPAKADPVKQVEFINYYNKLLNHTPEDEPILFGDGVHPTMATKVTCGWIRTGKDKLIATQASRTRMNLMGSINLESMQLIIEEYETLDSAAMVKYLHKVRAAYPNAPKIHMILDRGPYNISEETREAARNVGIVLHYLPAYSPNLNPIERLWKVANEHVRNNRFFISAKEFRREMMDFYINKWPQIAHTMLDRINDNFSPVKTAI